MTASPELAGVELLGRPVPIAEIDRELAGLFSVEDEDTDPGGTRASVLNLALYSERPETLPEHAETIAEITREAACRSILICVDPSADQPSARSWIQAQCRLDREGKKSICSEQISFFLTGHSPGMVRSTVFSHLDSDLPLVFWWRGEFSESFEERLYSRFDRLIFDSETWANPRNQLVRLRDACRSESCHFCFHDLAYTRLNPFRHAISNAFDLPALGGSVREIEAVGIRYSGGHRMSALYLCSWIASRLGGELQRENSAPGRFLFQSSGPGMPGRFEVTIEEREGNDIEAVIRTGSREIEVSRCPSCDYLRTRFPGESEGESSEEWLPMATRKDSQWVTEILERGGRNRSFSRVLEMAGQLLTV